MNRFTNIEIRQALEKHRIYGYEIAEKIGMCDSSFSRLIRYELSDERKKEILKAIDELVAER